MFYQISLVRGIIILGINLYINRKYMQDFLYQKTNLTI